MTLYPNSQAVLIDIHSHIYRPKPGQLQVLSLDVRTEPDFFQSLDSIYPDTVFSVGVHPWNASEWTVDAVSSLERVFRHRRVCLIGEIGLDKACQVPNNQQRSIFEAQLEIASSIGKPVLIHSVRSMAELLVVKKKFKNIPAWILHGFRGKPEDAKLYLHHGFYLSFGQSCNKESVRLCPLDRLFLETDEHPLDISAFYNEIAGILGCSVENLEAAVVGNFGALTRTI